MLYPAKLPITINRQKKTFHNKKRFKLLQSTNPAIQKTLEGKPQCEEKVNYTQEDIRNKTYQLSISKLGGPISQQNNSNQQTTLIDNSQSVISIP